MLRRLLVMLASGIFAATAFTGTAHAAAEHGQPALFEQQAGRLGLTTTERQSLQSRVDVYLKRTGGTQVALNKVSLDNGKGYVLLTLPGERTVRDISAAGHPSFHGCAYYFFCAFQSVSFEGDVNAWSDCDVDEISFIGYGSWVNNQTAGTRAQFKDESRVTRWTDSGAPTEDNSADWNWVFFVKAC
ncbi:hypothetical protein [Streptomyces sp. NPDC087856]|uniref:hypothetical protein n=1 Tax=Streptomyces sp. NPDC087856 TaxID=3365811 RepID=UPI00380278AC